MKIEHIGLLVPAPISMAQWYKNYLGLRILKSSGTDAEGGVFLKDDASGTILEFTKPANKKIVDFKSIDPLQIHLAVECPDPLALARKLEDVGASIVGDLPPAGTPIEILMVRDPWNVGIQLINRKQKLPD
jgi:catechol 2,3-dioxygenase-like lactoylglutathione lyase family enzyme